MAEHMSSTVLERRATSAGVAARPSSRLSRLVRALVDTVGRRIWGLEVEGEVPASGPAIIAANHLSFFDSVALMMAIRRPLTFVGKAEYLDSWKTRHVLPAMGMIPVERTRGFQAWDALEVAARVLRADGLFAIYPEGTRSRDGKLHAGHAGVGHLGVSTGAPIIPTGIIGTNLIQPPGARVPRPFRPLVVRFGRPIDVASYAGSPREQRRQITKDVMTAIGDLSGQDRVGSTAS